MEERGWDQVDFAYVIGDAYVDHPSFGHAIISRLLESRGYRVGIISQPDWQDPASIRRLWETPSRLPRVIRQYGFHGQSLFGLKEAPEDGRLHAGR